MKYSTILPGGELTENPPDGLRRHRAQHASQEAHHHLLGGVYGGVERRGK